MLNMLDKISFTHNYIFIGLSLLPVLFWQLHFDSQDNSRFKKYFESSVDAIIRFSEHFYFSLPLANYWKGMNYFLSGHEKSALSAWKKGTKICQELKNDYFMARMKAEIGIIKKDTDLLEISENLFDSLGCQFVSLCDRF